jgi:flavin reductase (DIM6/NTAB) family NADH-FMN oxidoreductase RutF
MSNGYPCRVSGCAGADTSVMGICNRHYQMLPREMKIDLTHAVNKARHLSSTQRGRVLAPAIEKALAWIEANENAVSLFGDDL